MIPRLRPYWNRKEILAMFGPHRGAIVRFEQAFAHEFESGYAVAYPYGRSALWAFLKALRINDSEVILPAYTCSVVAHAVVLSGNIPRFVDITLNDYNMDLDLVDQALNERTHAVVATHLFGYPLNVVKLKEIVNRAERRYGHKIWVIQDCAHSFGARWEGNSVCKAGDVALFGLGISKTITSIFGGMLTTNDVELSERLRIWRDANFRMPGKNKTWKRRLYLSASYLAFHNMAYGLVYWLQEATPLLQSFTDAYHLDDKIHFPPDFSDQMTAVEAQVGLVQLGKYEEIIREREGNARYYHEQLKDVSVWKLPAQIEGATYSHYVIRVPDRKAVLKTFVRYGIQLGQLIEYCVPYLSAYRRFKEDLDFPNSLLASQQTINLPMQAGLVPEHREFVVECVRNEFYTEKTK